jgi:hypothetical protein
MWRQLDLHFHCRQALGWPSNPYDAICRSTNIHRAAIGVLCSWILYDTIRRGLIFTQLATRARLSLPLNTAPFQNISSFREHYTNLVSSRNSRRGPNSMREENSDACNHGSLVAFAECLCIIEFRSAEIQQVYMNHLTRIEDFSVNGPSRVR